MRKVKLIDALLLTPPQTADALAISPHKLWGITAPRGPLACIKLGKSVRYAIPDLEIYINAQKQKV